MRSSDVPMMTLRRAVEWCGGIDALGDALNTTAESLERWLSGEEEVPGPVFLQAVGPVFEASAAQPPGRSTPDSSDGGRRGDRPLARRGGTFAGEEIQAAEVTPEFGLPCGKMEGVKDSKG